MPRTHRVLLLDDHGQVRRGVVVRLHELHRRAGRHAGHVAWSVRAVDIRADRDNAAEG